MGDRVVLNLTFTCSFIPAGLVDDNMLVQKITPEIIDWVRAQARAGHARDAVLAAMRGPRLG